MTRTYDLISLNLTSRDLDESRKTLEPFYDKKRVALWAIGETKGMPEGVLRRVDEDYCAIEPEEGDRVKYRISDLVGILVVND